MQVRRSHSGLNASAAAYVSKNSLKRSILPSLKVIK
jgi:hypothetical protein